MNCPAEAGSAPGADAARLLEIVRELVRETHPGRSIEVGLDSDLERELGLDSLARVELLMRVQGALGVAAPEQALAQAQSPRALLHFLGSAPAPAASPEASLPLRAGEAGEPVAARTLVEALDWHADRHPERLHILLYGEAGAAEEITYGALREQARSIATGLAARALAPGASVALMLPTGRDYLASFLGVLMAGGVPVPIYPPARLSQIEEHLRRHAKILANAEAALMITVAQARGVAMLLSAQVPTLSSIVTAQELRIAPAPLARAGRGEDLAFLQYTSGSTGDPKGVILTHANLLANIRAMGEAGRVEPATDVFVSWLPLYHDMGLIGAWLTPLYFGFPLVLMSPLAFLARPVRWLEAISRHRGTISGAPNFAYELVARKVADADLQGLDLSSWRLAFNGAEPVSPATLEAFASRFAPCGLKREAIAPVYGLAECSVCLTVPPPGRGPKIDVIDRELFAERRIASPVGPESPGAMLVPACGRAIPGHAMRIVDESGEELPERHVGRLQFRGPSATSGYYRNPAASAALVHGEWRDTGDYAYLAGGEVHLTGRAKDVIIRGGRNLYPYELEEAVGALPGVRRGCVAVFACPDPANRTERLVVLAETREADAARREELRRRIVEAAVDVTGMPPEEVVLAPPHTVLKTSSGKIRRAATRDLYERGLTGAAPVWAQLARLWLRSAAPRAREIVAGARRHLYAAWAWAVFLVLAAPTWALVCALRRPALARRLVHLACRALLVLIGARLRTRIGGRLPARPHVLVANHGSYLDAVVLAAALPPSIDYAFVAKREFLDVWWTRWFFSGMGALMVERFDIRRGVEDVDAIVATLAAGRSVVAFPEGTFTPVTGIRPFRMGAFVAAARAGVPLVAAGLCGVRGMLRDRTWMPMPGRPQAEIGAVVVARGSAWSDAVALREAARAEILRLSGEPDLGGSEAGGGG
ncbi:MAG: AMP-binding protein [Rhodocyclaceae bacterium]